MATAAELAPRLSDASIRKAWDVYSAFDWPERLDPAADWYMSPELISIHGTPVWDGLDETTRKRLSFYEIVNFFSFVLYGERPLVSGLMNRMYRKNTLGAVTDYLHHFVDEENKHMIMFGMFCNRYAGRIYPEKKIVLPREYASRRGRHRVLLQGPDRRGARGLLQPQDDERQDDPSPRDAHQQGPPHRRGATSRVRPRIPPRARRRDAPGWSEAETGVLPQMARRVPGLELGRLLQPRGLQGRGTRGRLRDPQGGPAGRRLSLVPRQRPPRSWSTTSRKSGC